MESQLVRKLNGGDALDVTKYIDQLDELSARAIAVDPQDSWAWAKRAAALGWQKRWDEAIAANLQARNLSPDSITFIVQQATLALVTGRPTEAVAIVRKAIATDPEVAQSNTAPILCQATLLWGAYQDAKLPCETAAGLRLDWLDQVLLVALYIQRNEPEKAALAKTTLLKQKPDFTIAKLKILDSYGDPAYQQAMEQYVYAGLRKAGIPEK